MNKTVAYVVYDFSADQIIDLENPANILTITPNNAVALQGDFSGHTIMVTALDRLHNESEPVHYVLQ